MQQDKDKWRRGETLELDIESLAFGSRGVARTRSFVWFVDGGIPGQRVLARIRAIRKQYGEAFVLEVISPSRDQIQPPCPYFGTCGGCQLQQMAYPAQAASKTRQIQEILNHLAGIPSPPVSEIRTSSKTLGYRNKMEFTFSDQRWILHGEPEAVSRDFALGLHIPRIFDKVLDIDSCLLQNEICNALLRSVREMVLKTDLKPYNLKTHQGFWRFLVIRTGQNTGETMLNFLTSGQGGEPAKKTMDTIALSLTARHPEITTILHSITDKKAQVAFSESERVLTGTGKLRERILGRVFEISPNAFFQTNTTQAEILFQTIIELAEFRGRETVYDLYCGAGAIGLCIADRVQKVVGIEVIESAVEDARRNAALNGIENVHFITADLKDALRSTPPLADVYGSPDVVILDPPRGGTHPNTIQDLMELSSPRLIYVSCNPAILARDLQILCTRYRLLRIQPVDMFPHTGHIETVVSMCLGS